jgi:hypothetical protein
MKDASMAKDIEEKVEEEVQALISAMSTLQAAYWRVLSSSKKRTEQRKRTTRNRSLMMLVKRVYGHMASTFSVIGMER